MEVTGKYVTGSAIFVRFKAPGQGETLSETTK